MNKLIEYFNNLNDQWRYALLVLVVFLVILLDVFFLLLPQMNSIADSNDQIKKMSDDIQQVVVDKQRIRSLRKVLRDQRAAFKSLSSKVPSIQEIPTILTTISSIANEYGVNIDQLVPEKKQQEALTASPEGKYYALPIVIKAHGGYHAFGRFLNKLENEDMYFTLKDFIIQNDENAPQTHSFFLTLKIVLVDRSMAKPKSL